VKTEEESFSLVIFHIYSSNEDRINEANQEKDFNVNTASHSMMTFTLQPTPISRGRMMWVLRLHPFLPCTIITTLTNSFRIEIEMVGFVIASQEGKLDETIYRDGLTRALTYFGQERK
jgi:hypothetical protein